jgi:hypothetical protein
VEPLDEVEDIRSCFCSCLRLPTVAPLSFEQPKEAFSSCIVRAASDPVHAALKWVSLQEPLVFIARKLTAAIRVKDHGLHALRLPKSRAGCSVRGFSVAC